MEVLLVIKTRVWQTDKQSFPQDRAGIAASYGKK